MQVRDLISELQKFDEYSEVKIEVPMPAWDPMPHNEYLQAFKVFGMKPTASASKPVIVAE